MAEYLGKHEIDVTVVGDGERGLAALRKRRFDVVLLDLMLPGADGLEICRRIRALPEVAAIPIIMLTARGEDVDRIVGLELGADDYLPKPFNPRELLARIRAVLRRSAGPGPAGPSRPRFRSGDLEIDFDAREVTVAGRRQTLTHYEFELLAALARAAGRPLSREQLLDALKRHGVRGVRPLHRRPRLEAPPEARGRSEGAAPHQDGPRRRVPPDAPRGVKVA